jgi:p-hydroxybenzoate 3-monooxygenase
VADELIYAQSENGFALASMRNENLSRYYIQVPLTDSPDDWSDEKFWQEFKRRMPLDVAQRLVTGPSFEKSIAPLRSFVSAPMRWGNLFLCGDAAHIVPPTGAKGLNLAISDVHYLSEALTSYYKTNDGDGIAQYSDRALCRVWQAIRFSWWMTRLLHRFPDQDEFDVQIQRHELAHLASSRAAQMDLAQNYAGLPL